MAHDFDLSRDLANVFNAAHRIVVDRGHEEGRNAARDFWDTFPHGLSDMTFMLRDKTDRVMGAEENRRYDIILDNCLDIINYAGFIVMWLNRNTSAGDSNEG